MSIDRRRRSIVGAVLGGGLLGVASPPVRRYLDLFAPGSGTAWKPAGRHRRRDLDGPYGAATVHTDEFGVPTITAEEPAAAWYAVGYTHGVDRLFQLDLQRRLMRGQLAEIVGPVALETDEFHVRMGFDEAAAATWAAIECERTRTAVEAYADGVNAAIDDGPSPIEFHLVEFDPEPWTPEDTMLVQKLISWSLTGRFRAVDRALVADRLGAEAATELYPDELDHDDPILRGALAEQAVPDSPDGDGSDSAENADPDSNVDSAGSIATDGSDGTTTAHSNTRARIAPENAAIGPELAGWLSSHGAGPGRGSNSWVLSGEHTDTGRPFLANDPHLALSAPPVWYEQAIRTDGIDVRGVAFPGVPFVVIGFNDAGAWGFTNSGVDVLDTYTYEVEGDQYRYGDEWRHFDVEERTIAVRDGEDRTLEVRRTVHGPYLERDDQHVGVAWLGLTGTRTAEAVHRFNESEGLGDALEATDLFEEPTQCLVYADADGRTLFSVTGRVPIRRTDGEAVRADRVFDGSAREGEWEGFVPYGESSWDGFIPPEDLPRLVDPEAVGTANQRIIDDDAYPHYLGVGFADPHRGARVNGALDAIVARSDEGTPATFEEVRSLQLDTQDRRSTQLVPTLVEAVRETDAADGLETTAALLEEWDGRMTRDSTAALVFARFVAHLRSVVFDDVFEAADLDGSHYPADWTLARLDPGGRWFDDRSRSEAYREALDRALTEIDEEEWETYGEYNTTRAITHELGLSALGYPEVPTDGSSHSLKNYRVEQAVGASWRMVVEPGERAVGILPGGNSGDVFSRHYDDQLRAWADGEFRDLTAGPDGRVRYEFDGGESR